MRPVAAALIVLLAAAPYAARAQLTGCPAHAQAVATEQADNTTIVHCQCDPGYHIGGGACVPVPLPAKPRLSCAVARERVAADLEQIGKQRELAAENQAQLAEWNGMGKEGRNNLVKASLVLVAGTYAANVDEVGKDMATVQQDADALAARVGTVKFNPDRYADLQQLKAVTAELKPLKLSYYTKTAAGAAVDAQTSWEMSKNAMHDTFSGALAVNTQLSAQLTDPNVREALLGPPDDNPLRLHLMDALNQAVDVTAKAVPFLKQYEDVTGPTIRITDFVIDASLADLQIWFSANGAAQGDDTAGALARAAGVMQAKYRQDVDSRKTCVP